MKEERYNLYPVNIDQLDSPIGFDYEKSPPIGIDIGTTNCAIARWENTRRNFNPIVYTLNTRQSPRSAHLMASWVYYSEQERNIQVGHPAFMKRFTEPENVAWAIKRRIGSREPDIKLGSRFFSSGELTKEIVKGLFDDPVKSGLVNPAGIVATVPFNYDADNNYQTRIAIEQALQEVFAHLPFSDRPKLLDLIPEPIAAAVNYAFEEATLNGSNLDRNILAFDLGGGTLDLTLFQLMNSPTRMSFKVLAPKGDAQFGGEDFDIALETFILARSGISLQNFPEDRRGYWNYKIREAVIEAKEKLSFEHRAPILVTGMGAGDIEIELERSDFEDLLSGRNIYNRNFGNEFDQLLQSVLKQAGLQSGDVHTILYIGGSSQIPYFRQILTQRFKEAKHHVSPDNTMLGVVKGAAIYAAYLLDKRYQHQHRPFDKEIGQVEFISKTSHSLGIGNYQDDIVVLIPANTVVPATITRSFKALHHPDNDDKTAFLKPVKVYQGEKQKVTDNTHIGTVILPPIHLHGRALKTIEVKVTFQADHTQVRVNVFVERGNPDGADINTSEFIHL